jgi:hypothetical protein
MDVDDEAFCRWATRRHGWLWRLGTGRRAWKSRTARALALRAAVGLMRLDRLAWRSGLVARR